MTTAPVDALVAAAADGVSLDGLAVGEEPDGYRFEVPGTTASGLSEAELRERAAEHERYVHNWRFWTAEVPPGEDRYAFLRWVEHAGDGSEVAARDGDAATDGSDGATDDADEATDDAVIDALDVPARYDRLEEGIERTWGQLSVEARLEDGERTYSLRHVDDADEPVDALERHDDPLDARELTKHDDRGRYRPLRTAPSLQTGWAFPELSADELVRAVDCFYPATVANWHREREGELDVTHWAETAERQTGIYDLLDELPREAVEWVAEACCVDSQCLRRREWHHDEDDEIAVDGGDGAFPCREPCSVVIAAARKWTILEGETERTYELELTPSEKHQLEELIDAVADGRVDEIREADLGDGANRYRARYLRAKRFDEDGNLCGVEGGEE